MTNITQYPEVTLEDLQRLLKEKCNHCGNSLHLEETDYGLTEIKCWACTRVQHTVRLTHMGRPPSGEIRKCVDCGLEFYVRPWQAKGRLAVRCGECQQKKNRPPLRLKAGARGCQHEFDKNGIGVCIHCGETRKYLAEETQKPIVVKRFSGNHFEEVRMDRIQELESALASKTKEVESLKEIIKQAVPAAPLMVTEAYRVVASFAGEITKTVAAYGLKEAEAAVLDSQMNSFDSLAGLLGDWIKLLRGQPQSDFDRGAVFGFGMLKAVLECERMLADRIREFTDELARSSSS